MSEPIVPADDPRTTAKLASGYRVTGESWGARLRINDDGDLEPSRRALAAARLAGFATGELDSTSADDIVALEAVTNPDYPRTPATTVEVVTGGAQVNEGSLAMNRRLGYEITERWLSLETPVAPAR